MKKTYRFLSILPLIFIFWGIAQAKNLPNGFLYVFQDNYASVNLQKNPKHIQYLYSDGATSCIIIIATGKDKHGDTIVTLSHISRPQGFNVFFNKVIKQEYQGPVRIYAQGANPPLMKSAQANTNALMKTLLKRMNKKNKGWYIASLKLSLQQGNPNKNNRDGFGINLKNMQVSNHHFQLTMQERDPTNGKQELYAGYARHLKNPVWLRNQMAPFQNSLIKQCMKMACDNAAYMKAVHMTQKEVVNTFSTTPQYEVPWFANEIWIGSAYTQKHTHC